MRTLSTKEKKKVNGFDLFHIQAGDLFVFVFQLSPILAGVGKDVKEARVLIRKTAVKMMKEEFKRLESEVRGQGYGAQDAAFCSCRELMYEWVECCMYVPLVCPLHITP